MKHILLVSDLSCSSQFKRGRLVLSEMMNGTNTPNIQSNITTNIPNNTEGGKRLLCYDILSKFNDISHITPNGAEGKESDKHLVIISSVLSCLTSNGDQLKCTHKYFRSTSGRLPPISLEAYIARLLQYAPCEKECFLAALLYMDRLNERQNFVFNSMNIHRSYLVCLLLAAKFFEDQPCDNGYFATVGGVSLQELNSMEIRFLTLVDFRVSVSQWEFNMYSKLVEESILALCQPRLFLVSPEPPMIPITPDTTNSMLIPVAPAIPMVSTT